MALPARLLRPIAGRSMADADAADYLRRVQTEDQQALEPAVRQAVHDFVVGCKADGIWGAIKASCILMGARTLSGALVPLVGTAPTNNNFVSGDYNRKTGLVGNGSNKSLSTGIFAASISQNSQHLSVYVTTAHGGASNGVYMGTAGQFTNGVSFIIASPSSSALLLNQQATDANLLSIAGGNTQTGFLGASRSAASGFDGRAGGATTNKTASATGGQHNELGVFARIAGGVMSGNPLSGRMAFYSFGGSVDLALFDTRVSALYTAIGAAIP